MKNIRNIVNDDALRTVNGGAKIDFEKIRKLADKINAGNANTPLGWNWGNDWGEDSYWK